MTNISEVYIVEGRTGEYSDKRNWTVGVFETIESADAYVKKINEALIAHGFTEEIFYPGKPFMEYKVMVYNGDDCYEWEWCKKLADVLKLDRNFSYQYTGVEYVVYSAQFFGGKK